MSIYRAQVAEALHAVAIRGPTRYAWLGGLSKPLVAAVEAAMDGSARDAYLVSSLSRELYWSFYCRGRPVPARWGEPEPIAPDPNLAVALSEANCGNGSWEGGWIVERVDDGEAVVTSDLRARVPIRDCRAPGGVRPGATVEIRVPKEQLWLAPGFYTALGDAALGPAHSVLRVYWNTTPTGASELIRAVTTRLNRTETPFRLKVADHPARLDRCDGAVLYLPDASLDESRATLLDLAATLAGHLRAPTPAFTLQLVPGVGLAEHAGGAVSFGTLRCRLLAEAIVRAHHRGVTELGQRIGIVAERFAEDGVDIEAPYREPALAGSHVL